MFDQMARKPHSTLLMKNGSTEGSSLSSKKVGEFYGQEATFYDNTGKGYEEDLKANQLGALVEKKLILSMHLSRCLLRYQRKENSTPPTEYGSTEFSLDSAAYLTFHHLRQHNFQYMFVII
jgi:hypothetical protein